MNFTKLLQNIIHKSLQMSFFLLEELPLEIQSLILSMCSYLSLYQLSQVSKDFKEKVENDEMLWRLKTMKDFGNTMKIDKSGSRWWKIYQDYRKNANKNLLSCVRQSKLEQALKILQMDSYINLSTETKKKSLFAASVKGHNSILDTLNRCGLDLDVTLEQNYTALILASRYGNLSSVNFLLKKRVNVDAQNKYGFTSLMWACLSNNENIVKTLLSFGAKVDIEDNMMHTPLIKASKYGYLSIVRILLDANADPNHQNWRGTTALMQASFRGYFGIMNLLLDNKADPNIKDISGFKAFQI